MLSFFEMERAAGHRLVKKIGVRIKSNAPRCGSITTKDSFPLPLPITSSVKNFFNPFPILPFWRAVMSSTAVAVEVNRCSALSRNLTSRNNQLLDLIVLLNTL